VAATAAGFAGGVEAAPANGRPWMDERLTADARASLLVREMTQNEKISLTFGYFATDFPFRRYALPLGALPNAAGFVPGIPRLGIPAQHETDAGLGVATQRSDTPRLRTTLPSGLATAATWNTGLAYDGGRMIGSEARLSGFNVMLAGGINLVREPRNGRNFEYAGEDPLLSGYIVGNTVKGIQANHVVSTVKHYALNAQATGQNQLDARIDTAQARMSDLLAFQLAIEIGRPGSVMCSYNIVNAKHACENDWLLTDVLKKDWHYKGYVMSDWGATHSGSVAADAGLDQESGYPFDDKPYFQDDLRDGLASGAVSQARLTDMAQRILRSMFAAGLFDDPLAGDRSDQIDYAADAAVAGADEEEAIALLKNRNDVLPLAATARTILVIGGHADVGVLSGGGSSQVYPHGAPANGLIIPNEGPQQFPGPMVFDPSSPVEELRHRTKATVTYIDGKDAAAAAKLAAQSDVVVVFATQWAAEGMDLPNLNLPGDQDALISAVAKSNKSTIVVLETGGPVVMPWLDEAGAVLEAWYPGAAGGAAIAKVLTGETNPSGHLPITFPAALDQLPRPVLDHGDPGKRFAVDYDIEGAAVGYKWFEKRGLKPLFPFGYGLSYSRFAMDDLSLTPTAKAITATLTVRNTGPVDGKDVPQIYVAAPSGSDWEAPRRLAAFTKISLRHGAQQKVTLTIDPRLLGVFDAKTHAWKIAAGDYTFTVADSSAAGGREVHLRLGAQTIPAAAN
jgi:beta-glucosidase